jgi:phosphopantothenoylcysteine decarboxylase/phosphopantothenate--cysteine ligase
MNQQMWAAQITQDNIATLEQQGVHVFYPASGSQACGDVGMGRMLEATELAQCCADLFATQV